VWGGGVPTELYMKTLAESWVHLAVFSLK